PRSSKREKRYLALDEFEAVRHIYKERRRIERNFAWKTKYRKLVTRYEKLRCTHLGFRYIAYAMINSREIFGKNI
ncbi:transposase, partial [Candidatus Falkowbacteria bacterium]|nr:transposase [Candidatus Falkowbacteria bacterium]